MQGRGEGAVWHSQTLGSHGHIRRTESTHRGWRIGLSSGGNGSFGQVGTVTYISNVPQVQKGSISHKEKLAGRTLRKILLPDKKRAIEVGRGALLSCFATLWWEYVMWQPLCDHEGKHG